MSTAPALAQAPVTSVPDHCFLCGSRTLTLKFPARGDRAPDARAYACTSFGHRSHGPIWECADCGMYLQWPRPPEAVLVGAYADVEDPVYLAEKENRYLTFRRVARLLGPAERRRLLDVGAYCGIFVDVAREAGFEAEGLELSRWAAAQGRKLGLVMHEQTLAERASTGERYDVVTMWDVVEHLADPRRDLAAAFDLVKPGGRLYVSTIDTSSFVARALGSRWPWLMHMHLCYFDRRNLSALLESVGFEVLASGDYVHTVSAGYLMRKVAASFPPLAPLVRALALLVPAALPVPVSLGDNMVLTARRPG